MITKRILVIDDEPQGEILKTLQRNAKKRGIELYYEEFNIGGQHEPDVLDEDGNIDIDKTKKLFKSRFPKVHFDLIACDWDLSANNIDGPEIMRQLFGTPNYTHTPRMLYSALLESKINEMIEDSQQRDGEDENERKKRKHVITKKLIQLIKEDYVAVVIRDDYEEKILEFLQREETVEMLMERVLNSVCEKHFTSRAPDDYAGRSYGDVLSMIQANSYKRAEFKEFLLDQTLLYLSKDLFE